jgi:hypothetical protein
MMRCNYPLQVRDDFFDTIIYKDNSKQYNLKMLKNGLNLHDGLYF